MKKAIYLFATFIFLSCAQKTEQKDTSYGIIKNEDEKSKVIEKLADSYLAGNFDIARDYFTPESQHFFNYLVYDVDGIIEGYNFHSVLFNDIKHNDRKIYTGYM